MCDKCYRWDFIIKTNTFQTIEPFLILTISFGTLDYAVFVQMIK